MKAHIHTASIGFMIAWLMVFSLLVSGCGSGQAIGPTFTPKSKATSTPTVTPTHTPKPTPTLTPTATSMPIILDGDWKGKTKQGWPISFTVKNNIFDALTVKYGSSDCNIEYSVEDLGAEIEDGSFSVNLEGDTLTLNFTGTFTSQTTAIGGFEVKDPDCGSVEKTWEASKKQH